LVDLSTDDIREFLEQACRISISNKDFCYIYPGSKKRLELILSSIIAGDIFSHGDGGYGEKEKLTGTGVVIKGLTTLVATAPVRHAKASHQTRDLLTLQMNKLIQDAEL